MIRVRHLRDDRPRSRAQSLVEYAMVVPIFLLMLLGMLELGLAFSHHLTMEYATREGARTGAALANGSDDYPCAVVDNYVIAAVQRVLTASGSAVAIGEIDQIRIYRSNASGRESGGAVNVWVPGSTAAVPSTASTLGAPALAFQRQGGTNWSACSRNNAANPDSIGVAFDYTYNYVTPLGALMGATGNPTLPMTDRTVMALNPDSN